MTRKWNTCQNMSAWFGKRGWWWKKERRLCPSSPSFLPFYCRVWAFSILWTQLSQNLEQANMTQEGVLLPQLTMYLFQIPASLQNYSSTFSRCNMVPEISRTTLWRRWGCEWEFSGVKAHTFIGQWLVEPSVSTRGQVLKYFFLSLNCKKILANYFVNTCIFVFHEEFELLLYLQILTWKPWLNDYTGSSLPSGK